MKKLCSVLIFILSAGIVMAGVGFSIPDYYRQSDFIPNTSGTAGNSAGGFFNPAVWGVLPGPEAQFFWTDYDRPQTGWDNWAFTIGLPGIGFGIQQWDFEENGHGESLTDYNLGVGFGEDDSYFGIGYRWSKGHIPADYPRDDILTLGSLTRPCRYASFGAVFNYAVNKKDFQGIIDLGLRPLGTPLLTLFGDITFADTSKFEDWTWGAGAAIQPLPGINIFAKYIDSADFLNLNTDTEDNYAVMAGVSLNIGSIGATFAPHFDSDNEQVYNTYGVRIGKPYKNPICPVVAKNKMYLKMDPRGRLKYQRYKLFDRGGVTLMGLLKTLDRVKEDDRVAGVALNLSDFYGRWEPIWEIREKLMELRANGKHVVIYFDRVPFWGYYLASAADRVIMDPQGLIVVAGLNMGHTYYKNMLTKMGLGFDEWRLFTYKSANESLSRTGMSEADREQRQALLDDLYKVAKEDIIASRKMSGEDFEHIINNVVILLPDSAIELKLVDAVGRWEDIGDEIEDLEGSKKKTIGLGTFRKMQFINEEWGVPPQIAVIYGLGLCAMDEGIKGRTLPKVIKKAAEDDDIKAIVFRADSPGGDPLPSDLVAEALKEASEEKPVIVSQGLVAASGGYWISMYGDKIVASPLTITGSIGVAGGWLWDDGLGDKLGLTYDNTQVGKHADIGGGIRIPLIGAQIPNRNLTSEERKVVTNFMMTLYNDFVKKVAEGRGMTPEEIDEIGQGRVWTGLAGKENGLVDELGGLETAIEIAKTEAGIKPSRRIEIVEMPEKGLIDLSIFQPKLLGMNLNLTEEYSNPELDYYRMLLKANGAPLLILPPSAYPSDLPIE